MTYYNENDPKAAAWLRALISQNLIAPGEVDERSIEDVRADDLTPFIQCHFFAGIGGWSYALRLAGWPDSQPVWTGSCPCQPFSVAGRGLGTADKRHLWPHFHRLISECKPPTVFGEQVASKAGREWLSGIRTDLETLGYAVGAADLCAAGVGAPHIRQRLFWVASAGYQQKGCGSGPKETKGGWALGQSSGCGVAGRVGDASGDGCKVRTQLHRELRREGSGERRESRGMANCISSGLEIGHVAATRGEQSTTERSSSNFWNNFEFIPCADGKARRIESSSFPLAHGVPGRVGLLRGYGNAIVPQVAQAFIEAYLETCSESQPASPSTN